MNLRRTIATALIVWGVISASKPAPVPAQTQSRDRATRTKSSPPSPPAERVTAVEGLTEYRLKNGLRVVLFPDPSKETATVNITYLVGSRHEGYGETGMAHLLEHLLFKGSTNHRDIYQELTAHGSRPNGTTWFDRTNYFETFGATEENLGWALDLEADRMVNSFVAKKDLDSEMSVVRNEFEIGENYSRVILEERVFSTAYLWHNYGKSTIGARADIEYVPIDRLQAFYRKWYQPDNAILVVAGKFDEAKTLKLIERKFGAIPRPKRKIQSTYTVEPIQDGERSVTLRRVGDTQVISAGYHIPSGSDPDFAAVSVLNFILADQPSGRLYKALIKTGKAASISADLSKFRDPGLLYVDASFTLEKSLEDAQNTMIRTLEGFAAAPPTETEVERARKNLLKEWEFTMRNSQRAALELSEWSAMDDWRLLFLYRDRLHKVSLEDVKRVAAAYLKSSNRTIGLFIPTKTPDRSTIPPVQDIASVVNGYKGGEAMSPGEEFDPTPDAVEALVTRSALPSGLKFVFLPKKTRGSTVQAVVRLHFGSPTDLKGRRRVAEMAGAMLMRGTTMHTRQELQDEMDQLRISLNVNGTYAGAWAVIEATRETLPKALRLAAEMLHKPAFPPSELELLRGEIIAATEESKTDPRQLVGTAMGRYLIPRSADDPLYVSTPEEILEATRKVTLGDIRRFHSDFYGASAGEVSIVGSFDPKDTEGVLNELFGGWKSPKPYVRIVTPFADRPQLVQSIEAQDKESAYFEAAQRVRMRDDDPEYPAMILGNFMTGGGFINSRLATRIRRVEGLSYGVRSGFFAPTWDDDARFFVTAIYAPQNAAKFEAALRNEMEKLLANGFAANEIAEAKKGWLQSRRVSRSQDRELADLLAWRLEQGRTLAFDREIEKSLQGLTAERILTSMRRHIEIKKITMIQAGDFAKQKKAVAPAQ